MNPIEAFVPRAGEKRLGDVFQAQAPGQGQFVFVGVPEDIGVRANLGRPGAAATPSAVFAALANFPVNDWFTGDQVGWAWVEVADLQAKATETTDLAELRALTAEVDQRVHAVLEPLFAAGKVPILVGGGHNNAYPLLVSASKTHGVVNALNLDPHPDVRALEGRHSGNGFSYAHEAKALDRYAVLGLSEHGVNAASLDYLNRQEGCTYETFESWAIRGEQSMDQARERLLSFVQNRPFGLEVCADGIASCPSSAMSHIGWTWLDVAETAYRAGQTGQCTYLHLAEASVGLAKAQAQSALAKSVAYSALQFIRGCQNLPW